MNKTQRLLRQAYSISIRLAFLEPDSSKKNSKISRRGIIPKDTKPTRKNDKNRSLLCHSILYTNKGIDEYHHK